MYREILLITTSERITYFTMGPAAASGIDNFQTRGFSRPPQYKIILSWVLLAWISVEGCRGTSIIPSSFSNFITTSELSGPLYISAEIYHTQINCVGFSLCIEHLPHCYSAILKKLFESFKTANDDSPIIEGPHTKL